MKTIPFVLAVMGMLCSGLLLASSPPSIALQKGVFLVATNNLHGTSFEKTVILLTQYDKRGAVGIAINRPTTILLQDVLPTLKDEEAIKNRYLYLGGPVHPYAIMVLEQGKRELPGLQQITDDIYFSAGLDALNGALALKGADKLRVYSGYAGWAAGQLENELSRGDWLVVEAQTSQVFHARAEEVWQQIHSAWSGQWI